MIKQGNSFNKNKRKYKRRVKKKNLKKISNNRFDSALQFIDSNFFGIEGMVEGMGDDDSQDLQTLKTLETNFNKALNEYNALYDNYLNNVVQSRQSSGLSDNVIMQNGDQKWFVSKYGVKRKITDAYWAAETAKTQRTCSEPIASTEEEINKFETGPQMREGEKCSEGGKNVFDATTQKYAWIDVKGYKHVYSNYLTGKHESCPKTHSPIDNNSYVAIPTAVGPDGNPKPWTKLDECLYTNHDSDIITQLETKNTALIELIGEMKNNIERINNENNENTDSKNSANSKFDTIMGDLEMHKSELNNLREDISTLDGDFVTQTNRVKTIKTVHFIWGMAGLSILFLILNNIQRQ
tara:strand:- start:224 stop:1279 length:1056 start_codon:yes stop_codon:yes gene_type:complete